MSKDGRISGPRWNSIVDSIVESYEELVENLIEALTADGYPPFTEPLSEREQYHQLIAMRDSGDPKFWNDPSAIKALARFSRRYGNPPTPTVGAFGEQAPVTSPVSLLEGYL